MYEINDPVDLVSSDSDANASLKHLKSVYQVKIHKHASTATTCHGRVSGCRRCVGMVAGRSDTELCTYG
jgi:hypothetical protein